MVGKGFNIRHDKKTKSKKKVLFNNQQAKPKQRNKKKKQTNKKKKNKTEIRLEQQKKKKKNYENLIQKKKKNPGFNPDLICVELWASLREFFQGPEKSSSPTKSFFWGVEKIDRSTPETSLQNKKNQTNKYKMHICGFIYL